MRGYERDQEYENWDEYEDDGDEQEEEEDGEDGYEEPPQPTQEELEYLELRQRIKESIRKQMKKDLGTANSGSRDKINAFRKDNYGSFFGPSQPVIAQRVIQESKSLLENPDLAARISRPNHTSKKTSVSAPAGSKPQANRPPIVTNKLKKKVEMLKNTRDYSFLLSEDAEVPASTKSPPPRNLSAPKSDARSAQLAPRSKQVVNDRGRDVSNGRDGRRPMPPSSQSKPKGAPEKTAKLSTEPRKQLGSHNGSGPGRPQGPKGMPSKSPMPASGKVTAPVAKSTMAGSHRPNPSTIQSGARKPLPSHMQSGTQRPAPPRSQPPLKKPTVQRKEYQESSKPKVVSKQPLPSSRDQQLKRPTPKLPARGNLAEERPKAKPKRPRYDEDSDGENAINMIRQMFGYNPNRFRDDDDVSDMEANFDDIMREEKRSAKIAKREDEEQLRLIEEEERRERMRLAKKRKLSRQ
ncbi:protein SPT2 homolog isoform X1 [Sesamum indicum]|uniref:Protein SPT2 homolog isoform X1 n=1 Tax=Sesamum indicum TaxID=4182 RepID=A0A6I9SU22_SESIN|nr:protein SPT2 homolog isoform X1 [Sesamum indicum]